MRTRAHAVALTAVLTVVLAVLTGCMAEEEPGLKPTEEDTMTTSPSGTPDPSEQVSPADPVSRAVADLAEHLGVDAGDVEVVSREEVTWRDGSLGCARKGEFYTQALVEGGRIVLRAGGSTYEYHYGGRRAPFRCDNPTQ